MFPRGEGSPKGSVFRRSAAAAAVTALSVAVAACGSSGGSSSATGAAGVGSTSATASAAASTAATVSAACAAVQKSYPSVVGKQLVMATDPEIPSYSFIDQTQSSTVQGFNIDWMSAVAACIGAKYTVLQTSFDGLIPALQAGRAELVDSNLVATATRLKMVDFVTFQRQIEVFLRKKGNPAGVSTIADLCGHSIAVVPSSLEQALAEAQSATCTSEGKAGVQISTYNDLAGGTQAVLTGRSDVFMEPDSFAYQAVAQNSGKLETSARIPQGDTFIGFALTKSETTLGGALLAASTALQTDGTEAKLFSKWKQSTSYVAAPKYMK